MAGPSASTSYGGVEVKVAAGSITWLTAGYLATLLIEIIPWLKDNLTPDQQQNLPIILAWLLASLASYFAPHTHRPDLLPAAQSPPAP